MEISGFLCVGGQLLRLIQSPLRRVEIAMLWLLLLAGVTTTRGLLASSQRGGGFRRVARCEATVSPSSSSSDEGRSVKEAAPQSVRRVSRSKLPTIAVIGRPNVGKSTFVNRICDAGNSRGAIVRDEPGITRDRIYQDAEWCGREFQVVDTGGLLFDDDNDEVFAKEIRQQAALALEDSCAAILVCDGRDGRLRIDEDIAEYLRKTWPQANGRKLPVVLAINKCENVNVEISSTGEFWQLGLGEPLACSAVHGNGVAEVLDALLPALDSEIERRGVEDSTGEKKEEGVDVAIVGRPNVGKSSLLNRFLGTQRSIVSDVAGTTRDAIDETVEVDGTPYRFIDTAGVRRRARVKEKTAEALMVSSSFRAVKRSDVVLLVVDSTVEPTDQDAALAKLIADDGRACVVIANKWDVKEDKDEKSTRRVSTLIREQLSAVSWAEILFVSALTGQRCLKTYAAIDRAVASHRKRVPTAVVNQVVRDAMMWQPPPSTPKGSGKIYYVSQTSTKPPTMVAICNDPRYFSPNYKRYLERKIRDSLPFVGTPIKLILRGKRLREEMRDANRRGR